MSSVTVRPATAVDGPGVVRTLRRSFAADPFVAWLTAGRAGAAERYFEMVFHRLTLPHDGVWATGDLHSVALWAPPGAWEPSLGEWLRLLPTVARIVGPLRLGEVSRGVSQVERARPRPPWALLVLLGTDPEAWGQGMASAVLRPMLERCDREALPAVLDIYVESNLSFYRRRGFEVTTEHVLPRGPRGWSMVRQPVAAG